MWSQESINAAKRVDAASNLVTATRVRHGGTPQRPTHYRTAELVLYTGLHPTNPSTRITPCPSSGVDTLLLAAGAAFPRDADLLPSTAPS